MFIAFAIGGAISNVSASDTSATDVVDRGLARLQVTGEGWIKKRGCVSCHQVPSLIWAHRSASRAGISVPTDSLGRWEDWSTNVVNFVKPHQKAGVDEEATMSGNIDTLVAMLLAIPAGAESDDPSWRGRFLDKLVQDQADDGSWPACGQLPMQKRPKDETTAVTTLWTSYALLTNDREFDQESALGFADQIKDAVSTEWWAVRLLVAAYLDDPREQSFRDELLSLQNEDGGWAFRRGDSSDALGTGYALYALAVTDSDEAAIESARAFLIQSQSPSGDWVVPGTKTAAKGKPTETANDWGTAWAIIALTQP